MMECSIVLEIIDSRLVIEDTTGITELEVSKSHNVLDENSDSHMR